MIPAKNFAGFFVVALSAVLVSCGAVESADRTGGQTVAADLTDGEAFLNEIAGESELFALGVAKTAKKKANKAAAKSARILEREANVRASTEKLAAIRAMPHSNLIEASAKCDAISQAVSFLKSKNNPVKPFMGLRKNFRAALKKERDQMLNALGVVSCQKVRANVAALQNVSSADETPPPTDPVDDVPLTAEKR